MPNAIQPTIESLELSLESIGDSADAVQRVNEIVGCLRSLPRTTPPERLATLLIDAAFFYYSDGSSTASGIAPIALAVVLAEQCTVRRLLRRALSVQGLLLGSTGSLGDSLDSLRRALSLAVETNDVMGEAAAWMNIGAVYHASTLFNESRGACKQAIRLGPTLPTVKDVHTILPRAHLGVAIANLKLHNDQAASLALESARSAVGATDSITLTEIECAETALLLRGGHIDEAALHARAALDAAASSGMFRNRVNAEAVAALVAVYQGDHDKGLARLDATLSQKMDDALREEVLEWCVTGYERAGRNDRAAQLSRERIRHALVARSRLVRLAVEKPLLAQTSGLSPLPDRLRLGLAEKLQQLQARSRSLLQAPWQRASKSQPTQSEDTLSSKPTLTARLRELKQALDDGLVSADEYAASRAAILAAFADPMSL